MMMGRVRESLAKLIHRESRVGRERAAAESEYGRVSEREVGVNLAAERLERGVRQGCAGVSVRLTRERETTKEQEESLAAHSLPEQVC